METQVQSPTTTAIAKNNFLVATTTEIFAAVELALIPTTPEQQLIQALRDENAKLRSETVAGQLEALRVEHKKTLRQQYIVEPGSDAEFNNSIAEMELMSQIQLLDTLGQFREHKAYYEASRNGEQPSQEYFDKLRRLQEELTAINYDWYEETFSYTPLGKETYRCGHDTEMDAYYEDKENDRIWYATDEGQAYLREQEAYRKTPEYAQEQAAHAAAWEVESEKYAEAHGFEYENLFDEDFFSNDANFA